MIYQNRLLQKLEFCKNHENKNLENGILFVPRLSTDFYQKSGKPEKFTKTGCFKQICHKISKYNTFLTIISGISDFS